MKIFIKLLFIMILFGCNTTQLSHHYILYDYYTCNPKTKNSFLVINGEKSAFYEDENFNNYLECLELRGSMADDCGIYDNFIDYRQCLDLKGNFISKCDILGRIFADEDTIRSVRKGNYFFHFLKVYETRMTDTIRDDLNRSVVVNQDVMIDTVWQKIFSYIKDDTINIPKFIYAPKYKNTVYTGIDTEFTVREKVYNCAKFIVDIGSAGYKILFIEKNTGIEFWKLEMWSDERIKSVQSDTNFHCNAVNPVISLKIKDIIPVKRKYRKKDFGF